MAAANPTTPAPESNAANYLVLNKARVSNGTPGGDIRLHDAAGHFHTIRHDQFDYFAAINVDAIYQKTLVYKFGETINTVPGDIVIVLNNKADGRLELLVVGREGAKGPFYTLPGLPVDGASSNALGDPLPHIHVATEALSNVKITTDENHAFGLLSLGDESNDSSYKQAVNGLMYRSSVTTTELGSFISKTISVGPLDIVISFDASKLEGSVSARILGYSLGTAKFSPSHPASLSINVLLAKASVAVSIQGSCVYLEAHASAFGQHADFGPAKLFCI